MILMISQFIYKTSPVHIHIQGLFFVRLYDGQTGIRIHGVNYGELNNSLLKNEK